MLKTRQICGQVIWPQLLPHRLPTKRIITDNFVAFISTCVKQQFYKWSTILSKSKRQCRYIFIWQNNSNRNNFYITFSQYFQAVQCWLDYLQCTLINGVYFLKSQILIFITISTYHEPLVPKKVCLMVLPSSWCVSAAWKALLDATGWSEEVEGNRSCNKDESSSPSWLSDTLSVLSTW